MTTRLATSPAEAARTLQRYAKRHSAGAFATPTAKELEAAAAEGRLHEWPGVVAVGRRLTRDSTRTDYTGRRYVLPGGSLVLTHLAVEDGAEVPDLDPWDWVFGYLEDRTLTAALLAQHREVRAVRVSAASELIACWGRLGDGHAYPRAEAASFTRIPIDVDPARRDAIRGEVAAISEWHDDFPYYSDGSWDAVSLRGFDPADPTMGVKPSEMGKAWWRANPDAHRYDRCDWTTIAERLPVTRALVAEVEWWGDLERVRLLRMQGRDGRGGNLARHTDVGDKAAGVADGQIARFHLPIVTHPDVTMTVWGLDGLAREAHLEPWHLWYLDARKPHAVANRAGIDRVHLVVDVVADRRVRDAITAGAEVGPGGP